MIEMAEELTGKTIWNEAGKAGMALGIATIVLTVLASLVTKIGGGAMALFLTSVLSFLIWAAKFVGCIFIMRYFMKKFVRDHEDIDNRTSYRFGVASALLSAIIVAAFNLAYVTYIDPEAMNAALDAVMSQYSSMLDANSMAAIDGMKDNMPTITFFSNLIYCFIYGWILSAILSRNIPSRNPFEN